MSISAVVSYVSAFKILCRSQCKAFVRLRGKLKLPAVQLLEETLIPLELLLKLKEKIDCRKLFRLIAKNQ